MCEKPRFRLNVITGDELRPFANRVKDLGERDCFPTVRGYVFGERSDKVLILYGLYGTGKKTLIGQVLLEMDEVMLERSALIIVREGDTALDLYLDLTALGERGFEFVFVDEVTLIDNFIETSSFLPERFVAGGMRIVLSGTDSLGFIFAENDLLYGRCITVHTTYIPYHEFNRVLGQSDIDRYIEQGGTMTSGWENTEGYIDLAMAHNIQHTLNQYRYGRRQDELGGSSDNVNRTIWNLNQRFVSDILIGDGPSEDTDEDEVREPMTAPEGCGYPVDSEEAYVGAVVEYLKLLDFMVDVDVHRTSTEIEMTTRSVITQPGLRYAQAKALVKDLMEDDRFNGLSEEERIRMERRVMDSIRRMMMRDIVLSETRIALPLSNVFILQFPTGEFDMVIKDDTGCRIFAMEYGDVSEPHQYRHLINEEMCAKTVYHYGPIREKCVIYRGETHWEGEIHYVNVEEYLIGLGDPTANGSASSCSHGRSG